MEKATSDVLIIGAGPAGTTAAFILASRGLKVVLLDRKDLDLVDPNALQIQSHTIPYGNYLETPGNANVLLVGDAAGLADPFIGEGIYYAHRSAQLAAQAALESRSHPESAIGRYSEVLIPLAVVGFRLRVVGEHTRFDQLDDDLPREKLGKGRGPGISDIDKGGRHAGGSAFDRKRDLIAPVVAVAVQGLIFFNLLFGQIERQGLTCGFGSLDDIFESSDPEALDLALAQMMKRRRGCTTDGFKCP